MIQTLPAVVIGLYTRWFNGWALIAPALNLAVSAIATVLLGRRGRGPDETEPVEYDELRETREPAPTVGAGV